MTSYATERGGEGLSEEVVRKLPNEKIILITYLQFVPFDIFSSGCVCTAD